MAHLISDFKGRTSELPEVDPGELNKIGMKDFGCKPVELAREYGDKGTISKVLSYKQALSLTRVVSSAGCYTFRRTPYEYELRQ